MKKGFIKYVLAILVVLVVVFLSQHQTYLSGNNSDTVISKLADKGKASLAQVSDWVTSNVSKLIGGVKNGGEALEQSVGIKKNNSDASGEGNEKVFSSSEKNIFNQ